MNTNSPETDPTIDYILLGVLALAIVYIIMTRP